MKYVFIINPRAGAEDNKEQIRAAVSRLEEKADCELYTTRGVGDATKFVRWYCEEHPGEAVRFIACGGDGTVNEVFNGAVGQENVSVACYPCGSGNDFVKAFGGAERFLDIEALVKAPTRKLDLLKVGDRYANNVVNFGFDTTVAITINKERAKTAEEYVEEVREAFDTPEAWPQEFECEFLDASANLLSFDQITAAESVEATEHGFDPNEPGEFYGGFDFGGISDPSIFWFAKKVVETGADGKPVEKLVTRDVMFIKGLDTGEQLAAVRSRIDKCVRVCVDYTGPGRGFGDIAANGMPGTDFTGWGEYDADPKKFLAGKIEKFNFSETSKRELFTPFRLCFGKVCSFLIPHADWIRQDFHAMQMLQSGNDFKFWAPRMSNGHSDGCCAAALCKRAASFGGEYVKPFAATAAHNIDTRSVYGD